MLQIWNNITDHTKYIYIYIFIYRLSIYLYSHVFTYDLVATLWLQPCAYFLKDAQAARALDPENPKAWQLGTRWNIWEPGGDWNVFFISPYIENHDPN